MDFARPSRAKFLNMTEQASTGNDSDGDIEMVVEQRVEGVTYDNRLETQFQGTIFQTTDKRSKSLDFESE